MIRAAFSPERTLCAFGILPTDGICTIKLSPSPLATSNIYKEWSMAFHLSISFSLSFLCEVFGGAAMGGSVGLGVGACGLGVWFGGSMGLGGFGVNG